jgi:DNA-binding CsgD family transcriptional regulator
MSAAKPKTFVPTGEENVQANESRILSARQEPGLVLVSLRSPGRILKLNATAREILHRAERGKILRLVREWLRGVEKISSEAGTGSGFSCTFHSGRRTYALRTLWLEGPVSGRRILALLLERINPSRLGLERCRQRFGLSAREVDVILALSQGRTDKAIAEALGVGAETVRGYLKSIRVKLGVSTRTGILNKLSELMNSG